MFQELGQKIAAFLGEEEHLKASPSLFQDAMESMASFFKVSDLLPYDSFDPHTKVFINKESIGFVVEASMMVGSNDTLQKQISNFLSLSLPEHASLQVSLYADPYIGDMLDLYKDTAKNATEIIQYITKNRADYIESFAYDSPFSPYTVRNFRSFISITLPRDMKNGTDLTACVKIRKQLISTLEMVKVNCRVWEPDDLINFVSRIVFPKCGETRVETHTYSKLDLIRDQITDPESHIAISKDCLRAGPNSETEIRMYSAKEFPFEWSLAAMGSLIGDDYRDAVQIPCPFLITYGMHVPSQEGLKSKFMAKATMVERQANSPIAKYIPNIKTEADELAYVREKISLGEKVVQTSFNVTLFDRPQKIDESEQILNNYFVSKNWKLRRETYLHLPIFLNTLPMMWGERTVRSLQKKRKLKTTLSVESANLLPLQAEWKGTQDLGVLLVGRRGQIFTWSPFVDDGGNFNVSVVGRSGSGKSVFMQEIVNTTLRLGGRAFVLDVGRSFERTAFANSGEYITFTPRSNICLNPFSNNPISNPEDEKDGLSMMKPVFALMASPKGDLTDLELSLLDKAITETWERYKRDATVTNVVEALEASDSTVAHALAQMLFAYTKRGNYGKYFNGPSNVKPTNPLVVIEMEELKQRKDLQAVIVQMMIIDITNQMFMGGRQQRSQIIIDEAWDLLRGKQSGEFIEVLARRLRKYKGSLVTGTQGVEDFYASPGAQAAFSNSSWTCLLAQKPESIDYLRRENLLSMTPHKEEVLKSVHTKSGKYAEVMITGTFGHSVGRLILDPFSNLLYSTKAEDFREIEDRIQQGLSVLDAIHAVNEYRNFQRGLAA